VIGLEPLYHDGRGRQDPSDEDRFARAGYVWKEIVAAARRMAGTGR